MVLLADVGTAGTVCFMMTQGMGRSMVRVTFFPPTSAVAEMRTWLANLTKSINWAWVRATALGAITVPSGWMSRPVPVLSTPTGTLPVS